MLRSKIEARNVLEERKGTTTSAVKFKQKILEARGGIEPPIKVLQTFALPLGDRATESGENQTEALTFTIQFSPGKFKPARCRKGRSKSVAPILPADRTIWPPHSVGNSLAVPASA
jgi:hypothetical protein